MATLCLNRTEGAKDVHVVTFGDPRVFDLTASKIYNDALQETTIRVLNTYKIQCQQCYLVHLVMLMWVHN
ncbi:hypothetical protein QUS22_02680 [Wolbachia pipientis]|nr:hypothetical protein [Wolbachia pipientis]MDM8335290.1 hypothetical protein [Wolbachia pipientis]